MSIIAAAADAASGSADAVASGSDWLQAARMNTEAMQNIVGLLSLIVLLQHDCCLLVWPATIPRYAACNNGGRLCDSGFPGIFRPGWNVARFAGPVGTKVLENTACRFQRWVAVEASGGNHGNAQVWCDLGKRTAASTTKNRSESFGVRNLEYSKIFLTGSPFRAVRLEQYVAGVPRSGCLATALAVAVKKIERRAGYLIANCAAKAASAKF